MTFGLCKPHAHRQKSFFHSRKPLASITRKILAFASRLRAQKFKTNAFNAFDDAFFVLFYNSLKHD